MGQQALGFRNVCVLQTPVMQIPRPGCTPSPSCTPSHPTAVEPVWGAQISVCSALTEAYLESGNKRQSYSEKILAGGGGGL